MKFLFNLSLERSFVGYRLSAGFPNVLRQLPTTEFNEYVKCNLTVCKMYAKKRVEGS